ncbi:MAG: response regulator [Synergistaceae bacterium]|jgi:signal transduction histidine kinase/CheY-like chemotaxis protein|nr:response regulator [Synergistaceae bacterium]
MKSIRARLLIPFLAGVFAMTVLLSWYTYKSATRAMEEAIAVVSRSETNRVMSSMSLLFKSLSSYMLNIVSDPYLDGLFNGGKQAPQAGKSSKDSHDDAMEWISIMVQGNDYLRDVLIMDKNGVCVVASNRSFEKKSFIDRAAVRSALSGLFVLDSFSIGKITKKLSCIAAGPVYTNGEIVGAAMIISDLPSVVEYNESDPIFTTLLTPEGMFAAHRDKAIMGNKDALFPELYEKMSSVGKDGGHVNYALDGEEYTGYARLEPTTRWLIITNGLRSEVFSSARQVGITVLVIGVGALYVVSVLVTHIANGIIGVLLSLIEYAQRVSDGELDLKLTVKESPGDATDELGVLNRALAKLVETLQAAIRQAREASRMKSEFLANMSHEIRTPINAVIGMAHLSLRERGMTPKQRSYLEKIQTAARSLLGIINDILDISKIEAGRLELEAAPFNIRKTFEDAIAVHQIAAEAKSLSLALSFSAPEYVVGDALRFGQVLNNLLSNAIKFTQEGGVKVGCRAAQEDESSVTLAVSVSDTGIGISPEQEARLFQPFTQADASITRRFGGTGLGLVISKSIIELMGGTIAVESEAGVGTTFHINLSLPKCSAAAAEAEPAEEDFAKLALGGKTVLIAEDNLINQTILEELIAPSKVKTIIANNGREAVDVVASGQTVDLIFMDMQMPVMDGLQATKEIRALPGMDGLPIVAVTANAMKEEKEEGFRCGLNDYITKPVELRELYGVLKKWLAAEKIQTR